MRTRYPAVNVMYGLEEWPRPDGGDRCMRDTPTGNKCEMWLNVMYGPIRCMAQCDQGNV